MEIQPHDFRFTLISEDQERELPQAPQGWEESTLQWSRSNEYFGVIRAFSVALRFVLDGAWLLRRVMYIEGVDGACVLRIELLNRKTWTYDLLYEGDIDFSTFEDTMDHVEAKLMEMGVSASVAAFSNIDYEWSVLDDQTVPVRLPGIDRIETGSGTPFAAAPFINGGYPGIDINHNELFSDDVAMQPQEYAPITSAPQDVIPDGWFLEGRTTQTKEIRFWGDFWYTGYATSDYYYQLQLVDSGGIVMAVLHTTLGTDFGPNSPGVEYQAEFDITLNIWEYPLAGGRFYVKVQRFGSGNSGIVNLEVLGGTFNVSYGVVTEDSVVRAYRPKVLFQMLMDRMNGPLSGITVQSALLEEWDNLLITSGDAIRDIQGALIKTSFQDFFKSINSVLNAGFGVVDGQPILERKSYFFRPILLALDLGDSVKDLSVAPAEDFMFNSLKIGYPKDEYEVDQGREEYNQGQIWSTGIRRLQKQLDLSSVYRADQYGIEQLRIAVLDEGRDNINEMDKKNDNEIFFIHAQKTPGGDGVYDVIGTEAYSNISGISPRSSSYNLGITPKKNLLRHADYLAGALYRNSDYIYFESADKNANLITTTIGGQTVRERDDIEVSSLGTPLFLPYKVTLTTDLQFDAWKLLQGNAAGYIRFEWRDHEFYGYVLDVSQNIEKNPERTISLLLTPNSDPTKLII